MSFIEAFMGTAFTFRKLPQSAVGIRCRLLNCLRRFGDGRGPFQ